MSGACRRLEAARLDVAQRPVEHQSPARIVTVEGAGSGGMRRPAEARAGAAPPPRGRLAPRRRERLQRRAEGAGPGGEGALALTLPDGALPSAWRSTSAETGRRRNAASFQRRSRAPDTLGQAGELDLAVDGAGEVERARHQQRGQARATASSWAARSTLARRDEDRTGHALPLAAQSDSGY